MRRAIFCSRDEKTTETESETDEYHDIVSISWNLGSGGEIFLDVHNSHTCSAAHALVSNIPKIAKKKRLVLVNGN